MRLLAIVSFSALHNMYTRIHASKKLEKLIKKLIVTDYPPKEGLLGKWNATVFYVEGKKCWHLVNGLTKYNVLLADVQASTLPYIDHIFKSALHQQLEYDGMPQKYEVIDALIGDLVFMRTDNDKSTTGHQNMRMADMAIWKEWYRTLDNMSMVDLAGRMNSILIHIEPTKRRSDYTRASEAMRSLLSQL